MLHNDTVAYFAKPSTTSVSFLKSLLGEGRTIALCPYQEPIPVIERWLLDLNISTVFGCIDDAKFHRFERIKKTFIPSKSIENASFDLKKTALSSTILRTSGTTGVPKSALIEGYAHLASACAVNAYFSLNEKSSWGLGLPTHHVSGLSIVFRALLSNSTIVCFHTTKELKDLIEREQITHVSLVPTQLRDLLMEPPVKNNLKAIILGGDRLPRELIDQCKIRDWPLFSTYGLTETASMIYLRDHRMGLGHVLSHAHIISENGEIKVKAQSLFSGYLGEGVPQLLLDEHGFFATGDVGDMRDFNDLIIHGRNHHRIISGGENIQLEEIEEAVRSFPKVLDCIAIGVPDARFGEVAAVFVRYEQNESSNDGLRTFLLSHLPAFKVPKQILPWPTEPLPEGKSRRQRLKKIYHANNEYSSHNF